MSSWATFASSFTSSPSQYLPLSSPPTPTYTYNAYHQHGYLEPFSQRCYPQAGDQGSRAQEDLKHDHDYQLLQKLVQLRESKLADCSYLTRQRKKPNRGIGITANQASVSKGAPAYLNPTPPVNPASKGVVQTRNIFNQREYTPTRAPTGLEDGSGSTFQGEGSPQLSTFNALDGFKSSWGEHVAIDAIGGQSGPNDSSGRLQFPQASPTEYSSSGSATDSESEHQAPWANFTWSYPISREEKMRGVRCSAYFFDEKGQLEGLENSPVAIILTPPSGPAPKWRRSPNDPARRPRCRSMLHPRWTAKY